MIYDLQYKPSALKEIEQIKRSGNKALFKKLTTLLHEIVERPRTGTGQVEQLKHYPYKQTWSRRLNHEYRLVYEIHDDIVVVKVISLMDHYGEK